MARNSLPPAIAVMGPTASGKTGLAMGIADRWPVSLISVDSAQVYRGMDVGTAKPTPDELARYPHQLIDICDPGEAYSAARFREDALAAMSAATERGAVPVLVGGTMLYYRALLRGLSPLPSADPEVRARLEAEAEAHGWAAMHERLASIDPEAAERIHPNDPQRIQRALEVHEITGRPLSALQGSGDDRPPYRFLRLALVPEPRAVLHRRIAERFSVMLDAGFVDEVRALRQRSDLHPDLPSMRAVGYRQVWRYLDGEIDADTMARTAVEATRQLAKRQITWLRRERDALWYDFEPSQAAAGAFSDVGRFLEKSAE